MIRTFDASAMNALANHPSIHPWVSGGTDAPIDLTEALADTRNVALIGEGGAFLLQFVEPGVYEAHSLFLPEARGEKALSAARDGLAIMFGAHDADRILARCPKGNPAVLAFTRALSFEFVRTDPAAFPTRNGFVDQRWFVMTRSRWEMTLCP